MDSRESNPQWMVVEIVVANEMVDGVCNFCQENDSAGLELGETGDSTSITAYFELDGWESLLKRLHGYLAGLSEIFPDLPAPRLETRQLDNENWAVMWKDHFTTLHVGERFIVTPPWLHPDPGSRLVITIDPAEAFGTGTHETTQGCMVLLEQCCEEFEDPLESVTVLDVGCGSGILSIAAAKLGVGKVLGIDNDPIAVESARSNARINGIDEGVEFECLAAQDLNSKYRIVVANLDPLTLEENRDRLLGLSNHSLIVSGVPIEQWDAIKNLFASEVDRLEKEVSGKEWVAGLFRTNCKEK
jgi:ribosomal protein L11 methyltransferase